MNIPAFLTERLTAQYGEETARRIAAGFEAGRKTTLRVNRLKAEPAQIAAALADAGISARRVPWSEDALVLEGAGEAQRGVARTRTVLVDAPALQIEGSPVQRESPSRRGSASPTRGHQIAQTPACLLYTSPSPRDTR